MLAFHPSNRSSSNHSSDGSAPAEPDYYDGTLTVAELVGGVTSPACVSKKTPAFKVGADYRAAKPHSMVERVDYRVPAAMCGGSVTAFGAVDVGGHGADYRNPEPVDRNRDGGGAAVINPEQTYMTAESLGNKEDQAIYYQATIAEDGELKPETPRYAVEWDYRQFASQQWLSAADAPDPAEHSGCSWYHGNITREEAERRLLRARASSSSRDTSNLFLVREKVAGATFAVSVLSPMPGYAADLLAKPEMNEITHHLVARAKRTDGTLGSHYLVNSVHRLRECKTLFAVLCELSKPGLPAFASSEKKLPGLPLTECCVRQQQRVFGASSYKAKPRKASGINGVAAAASQLRQPKQHRSTLRANPISTLSAAVSG